MLTKISLAIIAALALASTANAVPSCVSLVSTSLANATITTAEEIPAGQFTPPSAARAINNLPAFCRVAATLKPTADSDIRIEVWLPLSTWNGKFEAVGNGGWGGAIEYSAMAAAIQHGYATSSTDDGHAGDSGDFVLNHPERFIDFAYRSEHEMTLKAKALINAFYGKSPSYSYWNGCSGGGREGLIQAQRYPDDFNGVVAGDPANFKRNAWAMWIANGSFKNADDYIPPSKYPMIHQAVLDACDKLDGLQDGLINDPRICHFDPKVLLCKGADGPTCLTARQVQTAQTILSPMKSSTGEEFFPRLEPGTELRWSRLAGGPDPAALFLDYFKFVVFKNPNWDWRTFNLDRDTALANKDAEGIVDLNPDLSAFAKRGGKLIMYHGWADQQVAPVASIEFFDAMQSATVGAENDVREGTASAVPSDSTKSAALAAEGKPSSSTTRTINEWARLYMLPGMAHCSGGEGPDNFDKMAAIKNWVEQGKAPDSLVASQFAAGGKPIRTRPLCSYPQQAKYNGSGDPTDASNFTCTAPALKKGTLPHEGAN